MALATYADLQTSILSWLSRPGDTLVPTDDLITLFEADASQKLRTHWQETSTTITTVAGTDTYSLPADFLAPREVKITSLSPIVVLDYLSPAQLDETFALGDHRNPFDYTIEASSIRFAPIPDAVYTIKVTYWAKIAALSSGVNWLYTNFPDCYLFGALAEAELFLGSADGDERYNMFLSRRELAYERINLIDRKFRVGGAALQMKTDTGNP